MGAFRCRSLGWPLAGVMRDHDGVSCLSKMPFRCHKKIKILQLEYQTTYADRPEIILPLANFALVTFAWKQSAVSGTVLRPVDGVCILRTLNTDPQSSSEGYNVKCQGKYLIRRVVGRSYSLSNISVLELILDCSALLPLVLARNDRRQYGYG